MRKILVCTGVLGGGTALVFALAAVTSVLFPQGPLVGGGWNGALMSRDFVQPQGGFGAANGRGGMVLGSDGTIPIGVPADIASPPPDPLP